MNYGPTSTDTSGRGEDAATEAQRGSRGSVSSSRHEDGGRTFSAATRSREANAHGSDFPRPLGRYVLQQELGSGGMGVVYLATDPAGRGVAVKVLQPHIAADQSARARLRREFASLRRVDHPRVAPVIDAVLDGDSPFIVTRYIPGRSLDERVLQDGPLATSEIKQLGAGLGEALKAIHSVGVVHRDLKPTNVLMTGGDPVVIDFGIAQAADDSRLTQAGVVMGTPGYLPPEVLNGQPAGPESDWWAWAATLTFAATGRPPFGRGPLDAVLSRVHMGAPDLDGLPPQVAAVLRSGLSANGQMRIDPESMLEALAAATDAPAPAASERAEARGDDPSAWATTVLADADASHPGPPATERLATEHQRTERLAAASGFSGAAGAVGAGVGGARGAGPVAGAARATPPESPDVDPAATRANPRIDTRVMPAADRGASAPSARRTEQDSGPQYAQFGDSPVREHPDDLGLIRHWSAGRAEKVSRRRAERGRATRSRPDAPLPPLSVPDQPHAMGETAAVASVNGKPNEPAQPGYSGYTAGYQGPGGSTVASRQPSRHAPVSVAIAALGALILAAAASFPVIAFVAATAWSWLARTVYASVKGVRNSRLERGPRGTDYLFATLLAPLRAVPAAIVTVFAMLVTLLVTVAGMFGTSALMRFVGSTAVDPFGEIALATGAGIGVIVAWWGPGGAGLRRGTRAVIRGVSPGKWGPTVLGVLLALAALFLVIRLQATGVTPDWRPFTRVISNTLGGWF